MSYKILSSNPRRSTHHFFVDTVEDLQQLPKEPASTALVAIPGDTYICNNNKEWILFNNIDEYSQNNFNINTNDMIQELFNEDNMVIVDISDIESAGFWGYILTYNDTSLPYFTAYGLNTEIQVPTNTIITFVYESGMTEDYQLWATYVDKNISVGYENVLYDFTIETTSIENESIDQVSFKIPSTDFVTFYSRTSYTEDSSESTDK